MKKLSIIILIAGLFLGCKDDVLKETPVTVLNNDFYTTIDGLNGLVNGTYQVFRFKPDYNPGNFLFGASNDVEVFLNNDNQGRISSSLYQPDSWGPAAEGAQVITDQINSLLGTTSGGVSEGMYPVITRCNIFLENYANGSAELQDVMAEAKGEMLFIRAYAYYLLTNVLGDVPLILNTPKGYSTIFYFPKSPIEDVYKVMISDLRQAVDILPEEAAQLGRVSKPAAAHLLAKIYLNRAQAANWEGAETHLDMLYKGNVSTDLDSSIFYSTMVIDQKQGETAFGGLAPNFGDLWQVDPNDPSNLLKDHTRDLVSEIILSTQYEGTGQFNGRYGGSQLIHMYDQDYTVLTCGVSRNDMTYPRPFRAVGPNDWAYDMYTDRANDSRWAKTFIHEYAANTDIGNLNWTDGTAWYYNNNLKSKYPDRYEGNDVIDGATKIELEERTLVFIENSKDEPLDSLWVASQPYLLLARWIAGSPNGAGYFDRDGGGNITGLKAGITIDPDNPVVTDVSNREVRYRVVPAGGGNISRYGCDAEPSSSLAYLSPSKWWDKNRGLGVNDRGPGSIDIPLIRLAETYLIRAEALGRRDGPTAAIPDLNVIRSRAAYHPGENRSEILATIEPGVLTGRWNIPAGETVAPYAVGADSYTEIEITGEEWGTGAKAQLENYPPTATTEMDRFIHFIYNEKAREFIFEQMITEDLHNAGILYDRVYYRDYYGAPSSSTGTVDYPFPVDPVDQGGIVGATGTGRGLFDKRHTFKAWPIRYLNLLTDEIGAPLDGNAIDAYQNPGY
ncbi:RagB/SusD family nutrient uptake outer membrane protein [Marinoscillum sp. MHG1-6]|uniref:RagB/SusD family nutrient uptake outer membrane protein n=1 Tax=Marinoscillum sp. MHG1-6 TaxID=2959627 RepID=UPI00215737F8|nr:RagB/SusD family nutrient uptake outer membrane protein [Marinoscillum sp. MHG1-6]